jgi:glycosyltransferase involved in cell wall biosynthesis
VTELTTAIPVFNGERFLPATLDCLAQQTRKPDRLVIFDNGSTDRTEEIVANFRGLPCEFRRNESNLGVIGNLNRCLSLATETRYLHLLMADDLVKPEFCRKLLAAMDGMKGRGLGYSFNENISGTSEVIGRNQSQPTGQSRPVPLNEFLGRQATLATVLLPGVILKTDFQPAPCLFRDMPQVADGLFLAEWAALTGGAIEVGDYLCQYRLHAFNASSRHMYHLQSFVVDEWRVAEMVCGWIREPWLAHRLRRLKLHFLLAARDQVKIDMMQRLRPQFADEIRHKQLELAGRPAALIAWAVVRARDLLRRLGGKPTRAVELTSTTTVSP